HDRCSGCCRRLRMALIGVVGGGVIGSAAAVWLIGDGHEVTLFEPAPDDRPASAGNAGLIALAEISPLARPGVIASVPGWLLDPLGPLALRLRDLPALSPWLARFAAAARAQGRAVDGSPRLPDE